MENIHFHLLDTLSDIIIEFIVDIIISYLY